MHTLFNLLFLANICLLVSSCNQSSSKPDQANDAIPVNTYRVKKERAAYYNTYPGTVVALNEVELRSEVSGLVTGIFFQEGEEVKKGQKLYEIDQRKYHAGYEQARANVDIAKANMEKAQKDANRYTQLGKQDAIAKQRVDYALTDLQNAKLQVASSEADLLRAKTDLGYSVITAPFNGTIGISQVKMGSLVTPSQTLLNTISSDNPIAVDFVIDEKELSQFINFEKNDTEEKDSIFSIILPNNSFYPYPGEISVIDRAVDSQTGTIKVRLDFPNDDRMLRTGMSCNVRVLNDAGQQLLIPYKAVTEQMSEFFVYLADSGKAIRQNVLLGANVQDMIIVRNGLTSGDFIVTDGIQKLRDGVSILIEEPKNDQKPITQ